MVFMYCLISWFYYFIRTALPFSSISALGWILFPISLMCESFGIGLRQFLSLQLLAFIVMLVFVVVMPHTVKIGSS